MTTISRDTANAILEERNDLRAALKSLHGAVHTGLGKIRAMEAAGNALRRTDERCADCGEGADGYELRNNRCPNCQPTADDIAEMKADARADR